MTKDALVQRDVKFNIFTGMLKALPMEADDGIKRLHTTASSTIKDLSGDEMTLNALQQMAATAEQGMTIFLNHKYQVPEDVLGKVESAEIHSRGEFYDLDFTIRVSESNERAVKAYNAIHSDGVQLGCSIGALIPEGGATKSEDGGGLTIDDVRLLEASIVGIPANPRSFVQYAVKALNEAVLEDVEEDEVVSSGPPLQIKATPNSTLGLTTADTTITISNEVTTTEETEIEEDITKEAAPPAEGDEGESEPPDTESEEVPATQEAPQSDPESDGAAEEAEVDEQVEAQKALGLETIAGLLKATTRELVDTRKELSHELELRKQAETRASEAEENLVLAKQIIERVASLPLGRKTSYSKGVSEFRQKLSGLYSDDVMNLLERNPDGN
jgi:HK97 family phage prohead protease